MDNNDSNLEWEMALAAAESDGDDEINKQIVEQQKKEALVDSFKMAQKSQSIKVENKNPDFSQPIPQKQTNQNLESDDGDGQDWGDDEDQDGWGEDADGWGLDGDGDTVMEDTQIMDDVKLSKNKSKSTQKTSMSNNQIVVYTSKEINDQLPKKIKKANEILFLDNEDQVISVCRHFEWNQTKIQEKWFDNQEELMYKIGIKFDPSIKKKYPEVSDSLASKNNNMCLVTYCEFEIGDFLYGADSLSCGHQFSGTTWQMMLKSKVQDGTECIYARCPQVRCNMVVPHSYFLKYLNNEPDPEDGINYLEKYL